VHFAPHLSDDYFQQLTSETARIRYVNRRPVRRWEVRLGYRNEAWDCAVYALAALYILGPTVRASLGELAARLNRGEGAMGIGKPRGRARRVRHQGLGEGE
jgi:phage terminase large subunit GpA-like protein